MGVSKKNGAHPKTGVVENDPGAENDDDLREESEADDEYVPTNDDSDVRNDRPGL